MKIPDVLKNLPYKEMAKAVALVLVTAAANKLSEPSKTNEPTTK